MCVSPRKGPYTIYPFLPHLQPKQPNLLSLGLRAALKVRPLKRFTGLNVCKPFWASEFQKAMHVKWLDMGIRPHISKHLKGVDPALGQNQFWNSLG